MYRHKGILFQATRILQSPEGASLRLLKHWLAVTRRRSSQTAGTLAGRQSVGFAVQPLPDSGLEFSSVNHCLCLPYSAPSLCERLPAKLYSSLYFSSERHRHPFRESCRRCHNHHSLRQCAFFHGIHLHGKITLHSRRNRNHMYRII